jgi:hypothetical protein
MSGSEITAKRVQKQELSPPDTKFGTQNYDIFLEVDLKKAQYSIRSFAFGGRPYFQVSGLLTSKQKVPIVEDIFSCQLTPCVLSLFEGLDVDSLGEIPCFVTDSRKSWPIKFACALVRPRKTEPILKPWHARSFSADRRIGASLSYETSLSCREDEECSA